MPIDYSILFLFILFFSLFFSSLSFFLKKKNFSLLVNTKTSILNTDLYSHFFTTKEHTTPCRFVPIMCVCASPKSKNNFPWLKLHILCYPICNSTLPIAYKSFFFSSFYLFRPSSLHSYSSSWPKTKTK